MFLICLLLWILFNGRITVEILLFGIVISAAVYALSCALFGFSWKKDLAFFKMIPGILGLFRVLIWEIIKSNLAVAKMIWSSGKISPSYETFVTPLRTTAARIALTDCITLTPGTITALLDGDHYTIHCMSESMAAGLDQEHNTFVRQLLKIERSGEARR